MRVVFVTVFFIFSVIVTVFVIVFVMFLSQKNISAGTLQAEEYPAERSMSIKSEGASSTPSLTAASTIGDIVKRYFEQQSREIQ